MKKILAAILVCAFGVSAMAASVVYSYKSSFTRIDPIYKVRTIGTGSSKVKTVTESYSTKKDTIDGYIILPVCEECNGTCEECNGTLESSIDDFYGTGYFGTGYFTRKGDKLGRKANIFGTVKTTVYAEAGIFGKNAYVTGHPNIQGDPSDLKELKSAWMWVYFGLPGAEKVDPNSVVKSGDIIKGAGDEDVFYGFLGLDNVEGYSVSNAGFGSVKVVSHTEAAKLGFCEGDPGSSYSCQIINSIAGSTIGWFEYEGLCNNTPMWDLCDPSAVNKVTEAPIVGTWSLKYNNALSDLGDSAKEEAILNKLKAKDGEFIEYSWAY